MIWIAPCAERSAMADGQAGVLRSVGVGWEAKKRSETELQFAILPQHSSNRRERAQSSAESSRSAKLDVSEAHDSHEPRLCRSEPEKPIAFTNTFKRKKILHITAGRTWDACGSGMWSWGVDCDRGANNKTDQRSERIPKKLQPSRKERRVVDAARVAHMENWRVNYTKSSILWRICTRSDSNLWSTRHSYASLLI